MDSFSIDLFSHNSNKNNHVNRNLILMLLYLSINEVEQADKKLSLYVLDASPEKASAAQSAFESLKKHPAASMKAIKAPTCFDCCKCQISDGCRYPFLSKIENIIQGHMSSYDFNQSRMRALFVNNG